MKVLKYIVLFLLLIGLVGTIGYFIIDEELPEGEQGPKAEKLADEMLLAINDSAWQQTALVAWNFNDKHAFVWDKERHYVKVSWDDYDIFINLSTNQGVAFAKGRRVEDSVANAEFIQKAYGYWANDSFWLNPISKIRDYGTERRFIDLQDANKQGLFVTYKAGGVTPGDSYLYVVDRANYRPEAIMMWVGIIPVGGIEFTWEEYVRTETGAIIATSHQGFIDIEINDLQTYASITDYPDGDIFSVLE